MNGQRKGQVLACTEYQIISGKLLYVGESLKGPFIVNIHKIYISIYVSLQFSGD